MLPERPWPLIDGLVSRRAAVVPGGVNDCSEVFNHCYTFRDVWL